MTSSKNPNSALKVLQTMDQPLGSIQGNVMVYLIVVILIFGVLGVTIVSLFTTATTSSATPNNARRAAYVTESAMRYAFSELRNSGFATGVVNALNTITYNLNPGGRFTFNIFGPWFKANETKAIPDGETGTIDLKVSEGKLPAAWVAKSTANLWMVNFDYLDLNLTAARNGINSWTQIDDTTLRITTVGDFVVKQDERVCLAVKLISSQSIAEADTDKHLYIEKVAKDFFPEYNGAININRIDYVYKRLVYEPDNNRVKLENISAADMPNAESESAFPLDLNINNDFIVLSPRNYIVIPTGTADTVSVAGTLDRAVNIYDSATVKPITRKPDIDLNQFNLATDLSPLNQPGRDYITADDVEKTIDIGSNLSGQTDFGGIWFKADATVGGKQVCASGECDLMRGIRVFFTLDYSGPVSGVTGDGLTFALINAAGNRNSIHSIGGDIEMGELLGYAGDSRLVPNPTTAADFLDATGAGEDPPDPGLHPPKIALEFDTYNNVPYQTYCESGAIRNNNRNDPFSVERLQDALQFVFWGHTSLAMPCRNYTIGSNDVTDHPTYDDNRHDVGDQEPKWTYPTSGTIGAVRSTPAISDDGSTIYVGSDDHWLYAIDAADGSLKWKFDTKGKVNSSPVVGPGGMVYVGSDGGAGVGLVYGFNPTARLSQPNGSTLNASTEWVFETPNNVDSSPAIGADGKIYIGDERGNFFALDPDSRLADPGGDENSLNALNNEWLFRDTGFNRTSLGHPAIGPDPTGTLQRIYITSSEPGDHFLYALDPADGSIVWSFDTGDESDFMPAADPDTGVIYTDELGDEIRALYPNGITTRWVTAIGTDNFTPVVGKNGIVYAAGLTPSSTGKLIALNKTTGAVIWEFTDSGSLADVRTTPAIAPDGTVYFGSKDGLLYAVNPAGSKKWTFPIPVVDNDNDGYSSPAVGSDGTVYIGSSFDYKLYAVNDFAVPRNIKHNYVTSAIVDSNDTVGGETVTLDSAIDWLNGAATAGPWAVRLEVMRSLDPNADSKYDYTLHAWIRQCTTDACANVFGTFYQDTRIQYSATPHLAQTIELTPAEHADFATFIFGFTGASGLNSSQGAVIAKFNLSFIRFNDQIAP